MSPVAQAASAAAWNDEAHVIENRRLYTQKFSDAMQILSDTIPIQLPDAGFYFWLETPISDTEFTKLLYRDYNVTVLPGSYLGREAHGINPGVNHVLHCAGSYAIRMHRSDAANKRMYQSFKVNNINI